MFRQTRQTMIRIITLCCFFTAFFLVAEANPEELKIDLSGTWKFKKGDRMLWAQKELDDKLWDEIYVPGKWEEQGHEGYDGYAWYRTQAILGSIWKGRDITLNLGKIDDCDEVFFNGVLIGSTGSLPPYFETAWLEDRSYKIPSYLIEEGKNVIAIRVYDELGDGGFHQGGPYLKAGAQALVPDLDLSGPWEFTLSKSPYLGPEIYRREWKKIQVPGTWESQGYDGYNGYAYYRTYFTLNRSEKDDLWVLLLGKIDDLDEVYINGKLVGTLGDWKGEYPHVKGPERDEFRGYYLNRGLIKGGERNEILVKVFDGGGEGGIYQGPIGLISQGNYIEYWREVSKENKRNDK